MNQIKVTFDLKTKKLVMASAFHLADVMREFPSRRFDPKTKTWRMPLVAANVRHFHSVSHKYSFSLSPEALTAIQDHEKLSSGPSYIPFPRHVYSFGNLSPFQHQDEMLDMAWNLPAVAWFAEMGTGKTFATIHLAFARFKAGLIDRLCIVAPSTLRRTWLKELAKYATSEYDYRIHSTSDRGYAEWCKTSDPGTLKILGVSVEGLGVSQGLYESATMFIRGRTMTVVDESSRIKNPKALRTERTIQIGAASTYRLVLNGTPIALGIQDLWSQYEFLDPNILGTGDYWAYKTRYITMGGYEDKQIVGYQNVEELMKLITPYTKEVSKKLLNLPEKIPKTIFVEATDEQRKLFKLITKGIGEEDSPLIKVENTLERMLRLRQVVGGYLPRGRLVEKVVDGVACEEIETTIEPLAKNPKMDALFEMIEAHRLGSKFIIWSTFVHEIEYIADTLAKKYGPESVATYYGKTPMEERSKIEDAYCNSPALRFFVGNPTAAGLGLTLISGENDVMVYYSGTNAFIDRAQSEDRAHRIGQRNSVVVVDLVMERSVDEIIQASIVMKLDIDQYVKKCIAEGSDVYLKILAGERGMEL
jgi:SNF2 family DNA or RNA helicase